VQRSRADNALLEKLRFLCEIINHLIGGFLTMTTTQEETSAAFALMKKRVARLDDTGMDLLFHDARTCYGWLNKRVPEVLLHRLVELTLLPPTSANSSPARFVFISTPEGKEKLRPCLSSGNVEKSMAAPVTAIVAYDPEFWRQMDRLFPHGDMKTMFEQSSTMAEQASFRNGSMMGAYMIMAARSLGLDCGPMSGFDAEKVNETFLSGTSYKSNFLCNIGYGDPATVKVRGPKFAFSEIASIA
jgi:3-hydroxypropanoate dehydrogenase